VAWLEYRNSLRYTRHEDNHGSKEGDNEGGLAAAADVLAQAMITGNIPANPANCKNFTDYAIGPLDLRNVTIMDRRLSGGVVFSNYSYLSAVLTQHYLSVLMLYPGFRSAGTPIHHNIADAMARSILESGRLAQGNANDFKINIQSATLRTQLQTD